MSKPRILAGTAKGRELETPRCGTRPSPSRLREALFDIVQFEPRGGFLDLYSGSGAIGLEAASRGWQATCVDLSKQAGAVIRRNAQRSDLSVDVVVDDALRVAKARPGGYRVVFAAPPYPLDLDAIFQAILDSGAAEAGGLYAFQHPSGHEPSLRLPVLVEPGRVKRYGSNALSLFRTTAAAAGMTTKTGPNASGT